MPVVRTQTLDTELLAATHHIDHWHVFPLSRELRFILGNFQQQFGIHISEERLEVGDKTVSPLVKGHPERQEDIIPGSDSIEYC